MRYPAWLAALLLLAGCFAADPKGSSKITLKNSFWDRVNVQVVITRGADCDDRGPEFVGQQEFLMVKDGHHTVVAPEGTSVCWRKDRNPGNPAPGAWSGWSRAILFPGEDTETEA
jgi:hypothetical protein